MLNSLWSLAQGIIYDTDGRPRGMLADGLSAFVTTAAAGNTAAVAAVAGFKIRVYGVVVSALAAQNVKFQSNTTDISPTFYLAATGGFVLPESANGWFETAAGEALNLNLSAATAVSAGVIYALVKA